MAKLSDSDYVGLNEKKRRGKGTEAYYYYSNC